MYTLGSFYAEGELLVKTINDFAQKYDLVGTASADHICFRCGSKEIFEEMRALLEPESIFVYQSYISGRRIAILKLKQSFETILGHITILELSDQKPDNSQTTRFDHVEIYPTGLTYVELVQKLGKKGVSIEKIERPHHTTYDVKLEGKFSLKLTSEPLIEKIKREEIS